MLHTLNQESPLHHAFDAAEFTREGGFQFKLGRDYALDEIEQVMALHGIGISNRAMGQLPDMEVFALDTIQQPVTTPSISGPIQFYQNWLPGIVEVQTIARKADEIVGISTVGAWSDEQIVQQIVENSQNVVPYGDTTVVPYADWNQNFVYRTVVRFEQGLRVGVLEEERAGRVRMNSGAQKRKSAGLGLEIARNQVAFYGYNGGNNLTYGLLNDPGLPAYQNVTGGTWAAGTFLSIQTQLVTAFAGLRTSTGEVVDPGVTPITLTIATNCVDYLRITTALGLSVMEWLKEAYPNVRIVSAPQYNSANGGANIFTIHADTVADSGTDDGKTFIQTVPAKFQLLGIEKAAKYYAESYSNATAGTFCKRPYAVGRWSGI